MAFDTQEIAREVQKQAVRHEQLHEKLSRVTGPVKDYEGMTASELARYGLEKLGLQAPADDEDPCVVALESFLHGRAGRESGVAGMDSAGDSFVDRYIRGSANRSMDGDANAGESSLDRYINSPREDV
jgi:hypothetical protein